VSAETGPGPVALVGSGEYLPEMLEVESSLIEGRAPRYVQLATAAYNDGPSVVEHWHQLGATQAKRIGVEAVAVPVGTREDANNADLAALIEGAGLIYLSGGNPHYLANTLRDTLVWAAIERTWRSGAALAGCSAGAMAIGSWIPSIRHPRSAATSGLGLLPRLGILPHFDAFAARVPDVVARFVLPDESATSIYGIDELTALVGGPSEWTVEGHASVWHLTPHGRREFKVGEHVTTPS